MNKMKILYRWHAARDSVLRHGGAQPFFIPDFGGFNISSNSNLSKCP